MQVPRTATFMLPEKCEINLAVPLVFLPQAGLSE